MSSFSWQICGTVFLLVLCSAVLPPQPLSISRRLQGLQKKLILPQEPPLWRAILKLTCLLFVGSKVKLLTLPSIPPSRSPHRGQAVPGVLYLHGLESFHAEEKSWFTVKARGAVHAARVATLFTGRQWPYCSYVEKEGAGGKINPPFAMAKSYTCATERGGPSPIRFFKQSKQSLPTVNKMKMSKAFRQGGETGFRG